MQPILILKLVHILAAIIAVGANVTYAFWLARAGRDRARLEFVLESIRRLDRTIANPGYIVVLVTGVWMVLAGQYSFETGWIVAAIALYVLVAILGITLFAPAIRRQLAEAQADPTSDAYAAAAWRSNVLGTVVTFIVVVIVGLMVAKPF